MNYKYASLAILYMALMSYLSSIPGGSFPGSGSLSEQIISNLCHIPEYGLLTFLWLKALVRRGNADTFSMVNILILIGVLVFSVSDEIHQSFVPGRSASLMDIGLDGLGALTGLGAFKVLRHEPTGRHDDPKDPVN